MSSDFILPQTARTFMLSVERQIKSLGISAGQIPALLVLAETSAMTQAELAKKIAVEQPTMANTLKRMMRDGLVTCIPDDTDKRKQRYSLSPQADKMMPDIKRGLGRVLKNAQKNIDPQHMVIYIQVMNQILENLDGDA